VKKLILLLAAVAAVVLFVEFGAAQFQFGFKVGDKAFQGGIGVQMKTVKPAIEIVIPDQGA